MKRPLIAAFGVVVCSQMATAYVPPQAHPNQSLMNRAHYIITGDVDLYKEPGGKGRPFGILRKDKTYPSVSCRSDKWCQISGKGWVWGGFVKKVEDKANNGGTSVDQITINGKERLINEGPVPGEMFLPD